MAKMTLKALMKKLNKEGFDGNVYIGGKEGSSFFYIGPYDKEAIQKVYDEIDKEIRTACAENTNRLEKALHKGVDERIRSEKKKDRKKIDDIEKMIDKSCDPKQIEKLKEAKDRVRLRTDLEIELEIVAEMYRASNRIKKYERYKKFSYKADVEDVMVVEHYPKTDPKEPGMIIILDGCQTGKYWVLSEVEKAS